MTNKLLLGTTCLFLATWLARADDSLLSKEELETQKLAAKYKHNVDMGLQWLAKNQYRDGHWDAPGGSHPIPMTALAGMALLAEGSTMTQGKYSKEIENAVEYLL